MTHHHDTFDPIDSRDDATAAWLDDHFGLARHDDDRITAGEREAIRARVLGSPAPSPGATGIVAGPFSVFPVWKRPGVRRIASLVAAAVLVLIVAGTIGAYLRSDRGEQLPGAAATASVLPFAPGAALASPVATSCATDATLMVNPAPGADVAALADLPFPVAWYRDGTLTVQHGDEVLREIAVDAHTFFLPTSVADVVMSMPVTLNRKPATTALVNIVTSETAEIGPSYALIPTDGAFLFWASDGSHTRWSVTDLRTFETIDLAERFQPEPPTPWRPYAEAISSDGTVMLVGTTSDHPVNETIPPATPFASDLPSLDVSHDVILIDGSLEDISLSGPRAVTSGAAALSPDGATVAYLAPSDRPGLRHLTVRDVASGEEITGRPIDATYTNSLLFSVDGATLYATYGSTLERIDLDLATGFEPAHSLIELPDTGYQIVGASPDRTKLLLDRAGSTPGDSSLWVDLDTGELRELPGQPSNLYIEGIPGVSGPVARYVSLDDPGSPSGDRAMGVVDMDTGEIVISDARAGISLVSVSADGSTLLIPSDDGITVWSATGGAVAFPAAQDVERASTMFALSPDGACAAGSWDLNGDAIQTVLLVAEGGEQLPLPESLVLGWVLADDP